MASSGPVLVHFLYYFYENDTGVGAIKRIGRMKRIISKTFKNKRIE